MAKYGGIKKELTKKKEEPVPCIHGFGGDFISPAKKPGSAYKPLTAFHNLFILSHLQENAPPPARVSFIAFGGLRAWVGLFYFTLAPTLPIHHIPYSVVFGSIGFYSKLPPASLVFLHSLTSPSNTQSWGYTH
jgi:hypothetical protein